MHKNVFQYCIFFIHIFSPFLPQKATLVDREADGKQLKEGCSITENHCFISVAMETTEQSKLAMDCEVEVLVADLLDQKEDFSAKDETDSSGTQKELVGTFLTHTPTSTKESVNLNSPETSVCAVMPCQGQEEYLISETAHEVLSEDRDASVTSPVTDARCSPDRVYENEVQCEEQESPEQDPEQEPELEEHTEPSKAPEPEQYPETERDFEMGDYLDQQLLSVEKPDIIVCPEDVVYQNLAEYADEDPEFHENVLQPTFNEVSILEQCIKEEALSDVSNESCHNHDEMDECLTVEIAAESSDSETDEKWRTIFSSSINKEDDDSYLDSLQLSAQELFVHKVETTDLDEQDNNLEEVHFEVPHVEEVLEQPNSFSTPPQEVKHISLGLQGLSKISEDESENGRDANHNHTSNQQNISADKKLPKDFCVIQETKNENVSTEHVDFQLARKQWREMEEQVKSKIVLPTTKQPSFHGSHSFMYKPVRNIERTQKKGHELENLNLAWDYSHTQFSPCSDDSGLCDSSFRSPYDELETPIEREIRISMEREESFRKERELSRIPRSISSPLTPSFIVTTSATKEPHDMSPDNVIILDPTSDFASSPNDKTATPSGDWCSEDSSSNLVIPETSSVIIRSASDFSLNKACEQPQEKIFLNNPFFKLRSRSTMSLVDEEIKMVKQREEELKKERANLYCKDRFNTEKGLSNRMNTLAFNNSGMSEPINEQLFRTMHCLFE